jgi:hypothetical protein
MGLLKMVLITLNTRFSQKLEDRVITFYKLTLRSIALNTKKSKSVLILVVSIVDICIEMLNWKAIVTKVPLNVIT